MMLSVSPDLILFWILILHHSYPLLLQLSDLPQSSSHPGIRARQYRCVCGHPNRDNRQS